MKRRLPRQGAGAAELSDRNGASVTSRSARAPQLLEPAAADDRRWFENNPARNHRIRPPIGGEHAFLPQPLRRHRWLVVVRQVAPGARLKATVQATGIPLNSERLGERLFDRAAENTPLGAIERHLRERLP